MGLDAVSFPTQKFKKEGKIINITIVFEIRNLKMTSMLPKYWL